MVKSFLFPLNERWKGKTRKTKEIKNQEIPKVPKSLQGKNPIQKLILREIPKSLPEKEGETDFALGGILKNLPLSKEKQISTKQKV